jgi:23S rRNA pseudouridine1911/1915/1917 synthase
MKPRKFKPSLSKRVADRPGDFPVLYRELFNESLSGHSTTLYPLINELTYIVDTFCFTSIIYMETKMTPEILYEDNHIIVVNKPSGMLSQGDASGDDSLLDILKLYVKKKYNKEGEAFVGLVHRLDMPVSGVMVFARTSKAARRFHSEIISGNMQKFYLAVVEKEMPDDNKWHRLENFLRRERDITKIAAKESLDTQRADLNYITISSSKEFSMLLIKLGTGRKHQIRAQFSAMDAPVAGDKKYGSRIEYKNSILLCSVFLSFTHPTLKERMNFYSPPPERFNKTIQYNPESLKEKIIGIINNTDGQALLSK